jgi:hypothetical protein
MNGIMDAVCQVCNRVRNDSKRGSSFRNLLKQLRREFKRQYFAIKIKSTRMTALDCEEFYVNAYYDPEEDSQREVPIEIIIYHNFDTDIDWDTKHITELLIQIFDAIVHEFKHQRQSRKRKFKTYWYYESYLDDPDEIDAYSLSIAIELCRRLGKYRALRYMRQLNSLSRLKLQDQLVSPNLHAYIVQFGPMPNPIIKLLAKKIYIRLQKVDTDCIFV